MLDEVASCLKYHGKAKSLEDMEKAIQQGQRNLPVTAVDTNVIVRLLTRDDEAQFQKAGKIFSLCGYTSDCAIHKKEKNYHESAKRRKHLAPDKAKATISYSNSKEQ